MPSLFPNAACSLDKSQIVLSVLLADCVNMRHGCLVSGLIERSSRVGQRCRVLRGGFQLAAEVFRRYQVLINVLSTPYQNLIKIFLVAPLCLPLLHLPLQAKCLPPARIQRNPTSPHPPSRSQSRIISRAACAESSRTTTPTTPSARRDGATASCWISSSLSFAIVRRNIM